MRQCFLWTYRTYILISYIYGFNSYEADPTARDEC